MQKSNILKNNSSGLTDLSWNKARNTVWFPCGWSQLKQCQRYVWRPYEHLEAQPTLPLATKSFTVIPTPFRQIRITCSLFQGEHCPELDFLLNLSTQGAIPGHRSWGTEWRMCTLTAYLLESRQHLSCAALGRGILSAFMHNYYFAR